MTPNVVNYARHPPDLPLSVGQERSSETCFLGLRGRMFGWNSLPATIRLKSYSMQKLLNDLAQVVHTYVPLSPSMYNLVPAEGR